MQAENFALFCLKAQKKDLMEEVFFSSFRFKRLFNQPVE